MKLSNGPFDLEVCFGMRIASTSLGFLGCDSRSCVTVIDEVEGLSIALFLDRVTRSWISVVGKVRGMLEPGFLPRVFLGDARVNILGQGPLILCCKEVAK